ncbi:MAG: metallophosphoesterase [Mailhella sp.]|nr:metallophosphoesterase [Mailhella sp.]
MADYARNKKFLSASTLLMLTIAACMSLSLVWHEPVPKVWRVPLTFALVLFSLCITTLRVLVTRRPDLPFGFVRAGGYVSSAFLSLFWLTLLRDSALGLAFLLEKILPGLGGAKDALFRLLLSVPFELGMLAAGFGMAAAGMALALRVPQVRETSLALPSLPPELEGLRLVHLSDFHVGASFGGRWLAEVVTRSNGLDPDLVLITGDLADGSPERIERHLRPLGELRAKYGVFAVPGNHDYYSGLAPWLETWRGWGLEVLLNSHRDIVVRGQRLRIAGVNDQCARNFPEYLHSPEMGPPDARRALTLSASGGEASASADFTILLSHRPGDAEGNAALGVDLQLSGHTHGGQFFFLFPLVSRINKGFRSGLYRVAGMALHVSPGTGMWGYAPMRWGCRSKISLLVLTSE